EGLRDGAGSVVTSPALAGFAADESVVTSAPLAGAQDLILSGLKKGELIGRAQAIMHPLPCLVILVRAIKPTQNRSRVVDARASGPGLGLVMMSRNWRSAPFLRPDKIKRRGVHVP